MKPGTPYARNRDARKAAAKARYDAQKNDPAFVEKLRARAAAVAPEKKRAYQAAYRERLKSDPVRLAEKKAKDDAYVEANRESCRANYRKYARRKMGIIDATGEQKVGPCGVPDCPYVGALVLDHWHHGPAAGLLRGWICDPCNMALGFTRDNAAVLRGLAAYMDAAHIAVDTGQPSD